MGARVLVDGAETNEDVSAHIRGMVGFYLRVFTRPFGTCRAPPADAFCKRLIESQTAEEIATADGLSKEQLLDKLLLCLFDALFLKQSEAVSYTHLTLPTSDLV